MNEEQMNKYAYELMVKNNPEEAVKNLMLKDKDIETLLKTVKVSEKEINKLTAESTEWESKYYDLQEENERLLKKSYKDDVIITKAIEYIKLKIKNYKELQDTLITSCIENKRYEIADLRYRILEQEDLLNILGGDDNE